MSEILITTESGTDLTCVHAEELGIRVIPMYVVLGEETKADGFFPVTEVMDYYRRTKTIPTTSSVNPQEYISFFKELRSEYPGADIVHIAYTSLASSTYQNAKIALEELEDSRIFLVDSLNVSGGISLICKICCERRRNDKETAVLDRKSQGLFPAEYAGVSESRRQSIECSVSGSNSFKFKTIDCN